MKLWPELEGLLEFIPERGWFVVSAKGEMKLEHGDEIERELVKGVVKTGTVVVTRKRQILGIRWHGEGHRLTPVGESYAFWGARTRLTRVPKKT